MICIKAPAYHMWAPKFLLSILKGNRIFFSKFMTLETIKVTTVDLYQLGRRRTVPGFSMGVAVGCRGYRSIDLAGDIDVFRRCFKVIGW